MTSSPSTLGGKKSKSELTTANLAPKIGLPILIKLDLESSKLTILQVVNIVVSVGPYKFKIFKSGYFLSKS